MCGSGKSLVAKYLEKRGWQLIHFGGLTMKELKAQNLEINETNERMIREKLREVNGPAAYAKLQLPYIREALKIGPTVIDGLYSWSEYKYLRQETSMHIIATYTPRRVRYKRLAERPVRPLTQAEAEQRDFAEIENLEKGGPIAMADYVVMNDGSEEELYHKIDNLLSIELISMTDSKG
jgi:dephospho-CoA kinase